MRHAIVACALVVLVGCGPQSFDFKGEDVKVQNDLNPKLAALKLNGDSVEDMRVYTGTASMIIRDALDGHKHVKIKGIRPISVGPKTIAIPVTYGEKDAYPAESAAFVTKVAAGLKSPFKVEVVVGKNGSPEVAALSKRNQEFSGISP
jgi:hypothetical protein